MSRSDLILAADTGIRGNILRMDPGSRSRLFTIVESAWLARRVWEALNGSDDDSRGTRFLRLDPLPKRVGVVRMAWLVAEMDAARGLVSPLATEQNAQLDPPDPHARASRTTHRSSLKSLGAAVDSLAETMRMVNEFQAESAAN